MVAKFGMVDERFDALPFLLVWVSDSVDLELYYLLGDERRFRHRFADGVQVLTIRIGHPFCQFMAQVRVSKLFPQLGSFGIDGLVHLLSQMAFFLGLGYSMYQPFDRVPWFMEIG